MNVLITFLLLTLIAGAAFWVKQASDVRIRTLEKINDMRVEEARIQSAMEVSEKIGQDIHDEFSSSLAGIVRRIELLGMETEDAHIKGDIDDLKTEAAKVYTSLRDKSHFLSSYSNAQSGESLEQKIQSVLNFLLPAPLYRKEIDIESNAAELLTPLQRQEILKILQEAATNILKHATSATDIFVFLYPTEQNTLIFQIGDNGHTFKRPKEGLGIRSMRTRVENLKGTFSLETGGGTVITIQFPKAALKEAMLTA